MEHWQQLTTYIVSLEKEVQCYKQLIEEVYNNNKPATAVVDNEHAVQPHTPILEPEALPNTPDQQHWDRVIEGKCM